MVSANEASDSTRAQKIQYKYLGRLLLNDSLTGWALAPEMIPPHSRAMFSLSSAPWTGKIPAAGDAGR
jgi:hypothetical protein